MNRRDFLQSTTFAVAGSILAPGASASPARTQRIAILARLRDDEKTRFAIRELRGGLQALFPHIEIVPASEETTGPNGTVMITLEVDKDYGKSHEAYQIRRKANGAAITAATTQALVYAVFDLLERQGMVFGLDGQLTPIDLPPALLLPEENQPWLRLPVFPVRGLLPWPDFWNCISVYNQEDFRAYFANMVRMRLNMFGMHVYTQNDPLAESYLSFDFAGAGHRAALEDTTVTSWGYLPQRTSTFKMGAAQYFDRETFGSDATRLSADNWEIADRTRDLLRDGLEFAAQLGIRTGVGFEPYINPAEIVRALPSESKSHPGGLVESVVGKNLLERRLANLLESYPSADYVWLWQDETTNWNSRQQNIPLSVTPFLQAHDFLRRHAPEKQLILAGWGGIVRNFESLHRRLPGDIVFAALSDTLGWDPISDAFGRLEQRQRWVIPWLEDDPAMWFPQFRASHLQNDMRLAKTYGCEGVLGIHWRHRIVDPTATYMARGAWSENLRASEHYYDISAAYASSSRRARLGDLLDECDEKRAIVSTYLGSYDERGFANKIELTPDYAEGFNYDAIQSPLPDLASQRQTDIQFQRLYDASASPTERDRLGYIAGFVHLITPYCDAYRSAQQINAILKRAVALRSEGNDVEARNLVLRDGVPLWLSIAPRVRETLLTFQSVVATRNDQGQLASMQNKFVRIALERLRLSIMEFTGDLPDDMRLAYNSATQADEAMDTRVFLPTRPSILRPRESLRLYIVVPSAKDIRAVLLHTRTSASPDWTPTAGVLAGRHVFQAQLGPFSKEEWVEYYASASIEGSNIQHTAPVEIERGAYRATILG